MPVTGHLWARCASTLLQYSLQRWGRTSSGRETAHYP